MVFLIDFNDLFFQIWKDWCGFNDLPIMTSHGLDFGVTFELYKLFYVVFSHFILYIKVYIYISTI